MNYLVDIYAFTRLDETGHPMHRAALDAVKLLAGQGYKLHIVPQNLYEFWVVCTRPLGANGMGKSAAEAAAEVANLKTLFLCLESSRRALRDGVPRLPPLRVKRDPHSFLAEASSMYLTAPGGM